MENILQQPDGFAASVSLEKNDGFNCVVCNYTTQLEKIAYHITGNRHAAEDIVQESFLKLWEKQHTEKVNDPGAWLYRVVSNAAYKYLKRESRKHQFFVQLRAISKPWHNEVEEIFTKKELAACLNKASELLPERQREVYRLRLEEGLQRNEIANYLKISPNTVKVHLLRAHQFIKEHLAIVTLFLVFLSVNILFFQNSNTVTVLKDLYRSKRSNDFTNRKPIAQVQQHMGYTRYQY